MTRVQDVYPNDRITLREVGLRDGLQLVQTFPSTAAKQRWLRDEYGAGVRHFEVGSFLPAGRFPQFADVREIVLTVAALPGAHGIALALNERGVNEALASEVCEIASVVSATRAGGRPSPDRVSDRRPRNRRSRCRDVRPGRAAQASSFSRDGDPSRPRTVSTIRSSGCGISGSPVVVAELLGREHQAMQGRRERR